MAYTKKSNRKRWLITAGISAAVIIVFGVFWALTAGRDVSVLNPQGHIASRQRDLILFTVMLSVIVVVPVFTMLGVFAWKYREGNTSADYTPDVDGNTWLEMLWWGIPIAIIGILSVVTWTTTHELEPSRQLASTEPPLKVQVIALQWKWLFIYPDQQIASLNELRIPAGTPVNFELTADAPMSAFWIPSLGSQVYAMTGMSSKLNLIADKPGTYRGTNSNINGEGYADMNFEVIAMANRKEFDHWANAVEKYKDHTNLDWKRYQELAKQSRNDNSRYYHVHDAGLYTKVVNTYAHGSKNAADSTDRPVVEQHNGVEHHNGEEYH